MGLFGMAWLKHPTTPHPDLRAVAAEYGAEGMAVYWVCYELFASCYDGSESADVSLAEICARSYVRQRRVREILIFFTKKCREIRTEIAPKSRRKTHELVTLTISNILKVQDEYSRRLRKNSEQKAGQTQEQNRTEKEKEQPPSPPPGQVVTPQSAPESVVVSSDYVHVQKSVTKNLTESQALKIIDNYISKDKRIYNPGGMRNHWLGRWASEGDRCLESLKVEKEAVVQGYTVEDAAKARAKAEAEALPPDPDAQEPTTGRKALGWRRAAAPNAAALNDAEMEARRQHLVAQANSLIKKTITQGD